ncbi:ArsR/SmtB family transcription factor [Deinococcus fonticola]|uniref:ArsR/SmtB family transcription factor n=1 Tax=Deinococcus fonticola TaxID=2528713 RepID=UPI001074FC5C|nr:winged helix-turn-helix domain-containing protein [Deinococcus fonticola]
MTGLSGVASLMADPTRAHMLTILLGGQAFTAGELARAANVSPQTASNHLAQLRAGQLVEVAAQGRHRYYRLYGSEVAHALEALLVLERRNVPGLPPPVPAELRVARRCYDHLAGELGVLLLDALLERDYLTDAYLKLTSAGEAWFTNLGVDLPALTRKRRPLTRPCLDWSERRPHLGGSLGAALLTQLLSLGWVARVEGRQLRVTMPGLTALERELGVVLRETKWAS